jgi:hypothetical protein
LANAVSFRLFVFAATWTRKLVMQSRVKIAVYLLEGELSLRHLRDAPLPLRWMRARMCFVAGLHERR